MRNAFAKQLTTIAELDPRIVFLSGDIGNRLFDNFKSKFPNRFYNCGVAEANMNSVAAGLALGGLKPITYTITPFNTTRCLEQIKIDICYHNLPVIFVGVGGGLSYANLGSTHHSCEDLAFLRSIPNLTILCPADPFQVQVLLEKATKLSGPIYIRIGKKGEPVLTDKSEPVEIGKAQTIVQGNSVVILTIGNTLELAINVKENLQQKGIFPSLINIHTLKPFDASLVKKLTKNHSLVVTIEEHSLLGGLFSTVAEQVALQRIEGLTLLPFGTKDIFPQKTGSQEYLRGLFGLTCDNIINQIEATWKETNVHRSSYSH